MDLAETKPEISKTQLPCKDMRFVQLQSSTKEVASFPNFSVKRLQIFRYKRK